MADRKYIALLLRHGETPSNDPSLAIFRGRLDENLDSDGMEEAHKAAKKLKKFGIEKIVSSPLKRAMETAQIVADALGIKQIEQEGALLPFDVGFLAGEGKEEFEQVFLHFCENPGERIPRGESMLEDHDRVGDYFEKALKSGVFTLYSAHSSVGVVLHNLSKGKIELFPGIDELVTPGGCLGIYEDGKDYGIEVVFEGGAVPARFLRLSK